jgi:transcriptional regulator with XRE-family HTH domain
MEDNSSTKKLARHIGKRLRRARMECGLTGVELARQIGKSQAFISDVERGRKLPSLTTLLTMAQRLNRPPEFFVPASFLAGYTGGSEGDEEATVIPEDHVPALSGPDIAPGASFLEVLISYMVEDGHPWAFLEDHAGLSASSVNHIRQGFIPPREVVIQIADALGVDPSRLLVSAGYLSDPVTERALRAIIADQQVQALAFRIAHDFPTPRAKAFVLKLIESAKALAEEQMKVDEERQTS